MIWDLAYEYDEATYSSLASTDAEVGVGCVARSMCILETAELLLWDAILTVQILQGSNSCSKEDELSLWGKNIHGQWSLLFGRRALPWGTGIIYIWLPGHHKFQDSKFWSKTRVVLMDIPSGPADHVLI
jgi:hypothetical protein